MDVTFIENQSYFRRTSLQREIYEVEDCFWEREITLPIIPLVHELKLSNSPQPSNLSFNLPAPNPMVP